MISIAKYDQLLADGLSLDHYDLLQRLHREEPLSAHKRVRGFMQLLYKKKYLIGGVLTDKAMALLDESPDGLATTDVLETPLKVESFDAWSKELHGKMKLKLIELTGSSQKHLSINGSKYPFLPTPKEFQVQLRDCMKTFDLTDRGKIEKCLLDHCKNSSPTVYYYIIRKKPSLMSNLATDYENFAEKEKSETPPENVHSKDLFL